MVEALAGRCERLTVPPPHLLELPNVTHWATDVEGVLSDSSSVLELAAALHPTAAVAGHPRNLALRTIAELEPMDRGGFAGPVGWIDDAGDGELGLALRCAQLDGSLARLFGGCG